MLFEVAGGDCAGMFVARTDCTGDGVVDLEIRYLARPDDACP